MRKDIKVETILLSLVSRVILSCTIIHERLRTACHLRSKARVQKAGLYLQRILLPYFVAVFCVRFVYKRYYRLKCNLLSRLFVLYLK